jgi:uncharacterized protein (DUF1697 family)
MKTYISFLRGINIGGNKLVKMEELKKAYNSLDFSDVRTFGLSGNVIFRSPEPKSEALARKIESRLRDIFGFDISVLIRTKEDVARIVKSNPFSNLSKEELGKVCVAFLSNVPEGNFREEIDKSRDDSEQFIIAGKEMYLFFPNGYGRTKLTTNFFEKKLKVKATIRTLRVINKLLEIAEELKNTFS